MKPSASRCSCSGALDVRDIYVIRGGAPLLVAQSRLRRQEFERLPTSRLAQTRTYSGPAELPFPVRQPLRTALHTAIVSQVRIQ